MKFMNPDVHLDWGQEEKFVNHGLRRGVFNGGL